MSDPATAMNMVENQPSPISRLAPETLSQIFITYARIPPMVTSERLQWTKVTHVSQQWREVGLTCPRLWSDIVCTRSPWTTVMFERSKDVPLSLTLQQEPLSADLEDLITAAMSQPRRLRDLTILTITEFAKKRLEELTYSHTLRTLHVEGGNRITLPDALLSRGAPELKHVEFNGCTMAWTSPIFSGLTSLKLSCPPTLQQDATAFIDSLERMPNLETLSVALPVFGTGTVARIVPMACIKKLTMAGRLEECAGALRHMALPKSAILEFVLTDCGDEDPAVTAFVSTLTSSWLSVPLSTAKDPLDICSLHITADGIDGWFTDLGSFVPPSDDPPCFTISITSDQHRLASNLISRLPLTKLRALGIFRALDENTLSMFSRVPSIKSLLVFEDSAPFFLDFLSDDPAFYDTETIPVTRFPGLELLSLEEVSFYGPYEDINDAIQLDDLLDLLLCRCESGVEIQKIIFIYCRNFSKADFDLVGEVVAETEWDEEVVDCPPELDPNLGRLMFAYWMASQR